jgi:hypothetical protein
MGYLGLAPDSLPAEARHSYAREQLALVRERCAKGLEGSADPLAACEEWLLLLPWQEVAEAPELKLALGHSAAEQCERGMALLARLVQRRGRDLSQVGGRMGGKNYQSKQGLGCQM